ncbi:hypothetical protein [Salininema proteolyticum]|uniref:Uncharacterized protein n=1 Tax=Salininema proteolyticum TaxID=1607685 RepID=A0ABV8TUB2_9ACTN
MDNVFTVNQTPDGVHIAMDLNAYWEAVERARRVSVMSLRSECSALWYWCDTPPAAFVIEDGQFRPKHVYSGFVWLAVPGSLVDDETGPEPADVVERFESLRDVWTENGGPAVQFSTGPDAAGLFVNANADVPARWAAHWRELHAEHCGCAAAGDVGVTS